MRVGAVIQARTGSKRLPGKILEPIAGFPLLGWCVERLSQARGIEQVVVATSDAPGDDAVERLGQDLGFEVFRGSEDDVLERFAGAVSGFGFEHVVRVCGDSPFVDPGLVDELLSAYLAAGVDYASNVGERSYPRGLDAEVFSAAKLIEVERAAKEPFERAHVTPYFYQHPDQFALLNVPGDRDHSAYRWCVDELSDLEMVRTLAGLMGGRRDFSYLEALEMLKQNPEVAAINSAVEQKKLVQG